MNAEILPDETETLVRLQAQAQRMEVLAIAIQSSAEILTDDDSEFPDEDAQTFRIEVQKKFLSLTSQLEKESQIALMPTLRVEL